MDKKTLRQTTLRVDPELLRKARYYLDQEALSVTQFFVNSLQRYVQKHEKVSVQDKK